MGIHVMMAIGLVGVMLLAVFVVFLRDMLWPQDDATPCCPRCDGEMVGERKHRGVITWTCQDCGNTEETLQGS